VSPSFCPSTERRGDIFVFTSNDISGPPMYRAARYRRNAADCFAVAQQLSDSLSKARMLAMASSWLALADHAEQSGYNFNAKTPPEVDDHIQ
jgi:hypothetical protein